MISELLLNPPKKRRRISLASREEKQRDMDQNVTVTRRRKSLKPKMQPTSALPKKIIRRRASDGTPFERPPTKIITITKRRRSFKPTTVINKNGPQQSQTEIGNYFENVDIPTNFTYIQDNMYKIAKHRRPIVNEELYGTCDCTIACSAQCINRFVNTTALNFLDN
jgi:hypothetical protein